MSQEMWLPRRSTVRHTVVASGPARSAQHLCILIGKSYYSDLNVIKLGSYTSKIKSECCIMKNTYSVSQCLHNHLTFSQL